MGEVSERVGRRFAMLGALVASMAVAGGAFGAHALRDIVAPERLATFETGARYALTHGIALFALGALLLARPDLTEQLRSVGWLWLAGVALFSGSLWALALLDFLVLGAVTPFGGIGMIAGWLWLAWRLRRAA
ncbi:MAG TPA: DUF423 domain-containing protein [Rhodothermales bacterium]|nr:DUF423 domain-containing protein [Rhodothermales bacterium]